MNVYPELSPSNLCCALLSQNTSRVSISREAISTTVRKMPDLGYKQLDEIIER